MTTKKTIYIIRHGETDFNKKGIIQGSGIDSSLNDRGHQQARLFYRAYKHIEFNKIYTSQLKRTCQTISPFAELGLKVEALSELNEINWGIFEGVQTNRVFHAKYKEIVSRWRMGGLDEPIEGGESPMKMFARQKKGLKKILMEADESPILICMHGRAMRSFLSLLLQTPLKDMDDYPHSNLCLYVVDMMDDVGELKVANSTKHLS